MTCKKQFSCDLCGSSIPDASHGIAIRYGRLDEIKAEYLFNDGCPVHLCNSCVAGLRGMFAELDRMAEIRADLASEEEGERA